MNRLFIVIAFIPFIFMACQQDNQSGITHLHQSITQLEQRVDSLEKILWNIQTLKAEAPVKKQVVYVFRFKKYNRSS